MKFTVVDKTTGKYPDLEKIARTEEWAKHLIYCDIDGFYIGEGGELLLVDDTGISAWCDTNRFEVALEQENTK